jgi:hypothetical protein
MQLTVYASKQIGHSQLSWSMALSLKYIKESLKARKADGDDRFFLDGKQACQIIFPWWFADWQRWPVMASLL